MSSFSDGVRRYPENDFDRHLRDRKMLKREDKSQHGGEMTISESARRKNRYIPFRKADIVKMCSNEAHLSESDVNEFRDLCQILEALFHFEFHKRLETLKNCYAPFNPDADTRPLLSYSEADKKNLQKKLVAELVEILNAANFETVTAEDLRQSLGEESLFKIKLAVDFNDFEDVIFFRRGTSVRQEILVEYFGLRKKIFKFTNYDRVVVYVKFKEKEYFKAQNRKNLYFVPGSTLIKLFQNIPKADLEMLFPNSEVRMKTIDKLIIGVPAAVSGAIVVATKLGASLILVASMLAFWMGLKVDEPRIQQQQLIALGAGMGALGGFLFRQINKFKNRKIRFMKALSENLYFKNLDNNAGVFYHLVDAAEEEEFKEAVLAYYFILTAKQDLTKHQLDDLIEKWFEDKWNCSIDFEIDDAMKKLEHLEIVSRDGNTLRCKPLNEAKSRLDDIWDNYFKYHRQ
jgi:hypothetical protein